jgi:hypothetical protein
MVQLHFASSKEVFCPGGGDGRGDIDGSVKLNKGPLSILLVVRVVVVCQFGHMGVPHFVVALTTWPRVWKSQVQDHEGAGALVMPAACAELFGVPFASDIILINSEIPDSALGFVVVAGITRVHLPRLLTRGALQSVFEDVEKPVRSSVNTSIVILGMGHILIGGGGCQSSPCSSSHEIGNLSSRAGHSDSLVAA